MVNITASAQKQISIELPARSPSIASYNSRTVTATGSDENSQTNSEEQAMIDQDFLYIVIKHGVLCPFSICSSLILSVMVMIVSMWLGDDDYNTAAVFWCVLDSFVNSLCNYLLFAFNKKHYNLICGKLHRLCKKCKINKIKKRLSNDEMNKVQNKKEPTITNTTSTTEKIDI